MEDAVNKKEFGGEKIIFLGKGKGYNKIPGNKIYRQLINENKDEYKSTKGNNKRKNEIARGIIQNLLCQGAVFLENKASGQMLRATETRVLEAVKQALREPRSTKNRETKKNVDKESQKGHEEEEGDIASEEEENKGKITLNGKTMDALIWDLSRTMEEVDCSPNAVSLYDCPFLYKHGISYKLGEGSVSGVLLCKKKQDKRTEHSKNDYSLEGKCNTKILNHNCSNSRGGKECSLKEPYEFTSGPFNYDGDKKIPLTSQEDHPKDELYEMATAVEESFHSSKNRLQQGEIDPGSKQEADRATLSLNDGRFTPITVFYDSKKEKEETEKVLYQADTKRYKKEAERGKDLQTISKASNQYDDFNIDDNVTKFFDDNFLSTTTNHPIYRRGQDHYPEDHCCDLEPEPILFHHKEDSTDRQDSYVTSEGSMNIGHTFQIHQENVPTQHINPKNHYMGTSEGDQASFLNDSIPDNSINRKYEIIDHSQRNIPRKGSSLPTNNFFSWQRTGYTMYRVRSSSLSDDSNSSNTKAN